MKRMKRIVCVFLPLALIAALLLSGAIASSAAEKPNNGVRLTVGENIVSHYFIDTDYYLEKGCDTMQYTYNSTGNSEQYTEVTGEPIDLSQIASGYEIEVVQAAAQIAEPTVITVYKNGAVFDTVRYSSKDYCDNVIAMDTETLSQYTGRPLKLVTLCKSVLAYAKAAQGVFDAYMSLPGAVAIDRDYTEDLALESASCSPDITTNQGEKVQFTSVSFICKSAAGLRLYVNADRADYEPVLTAPEGITCEKGYYSGNSNRLRYIQLNNIKPIYFNDTLHLEFGDAAISIKVLDFSGIVLQSAASDENMTTLAKSLIVYSQTVESFFVTHVLQKVDAVAPSCTQSGHSEYYVCSECDAICADVTGTTEITLADTVVAALGHNYQAVVTAPTCTEDGYTTYTCSRCQDAYTDTITQATGHDFGDWTEIEAAVAATCTADGKTAKESRSCSRCEVSETRGGEVVEAVGHNYQAVVTAPTCTEGGFTTHTCSRCQDEYTDTPTQAIGHDFGDWTEIEAAVAATCTADGKTAKESRSCSRCEVSETRGGEVVEAVGHNYQAVVTAPTCTEGGYTTHTCSRCQDEYTDTPTQAIGHDFGDWIQTTAPTCTEKGVETRVCSRNASHTQTRDIAATGHTPAAAVQENVNAASCTAGGSYEEAVYCAVCSAELSRAQKNTSALGHDYVEEITAPTHEADGVIVNTCSRCSDSYNGSVIPALNVKVKLENADAYIYRVGNGNPVTLGTLFTVEDTAKNAIDSAALTVDIVTKSGTAAGSVSADTSDWSASSVKFTGIGTVELQLKQAGFVSAVLPLEIVNGTNKVGGALSSFSNSTVVLLGDVTANYITISNKGILYGNGFSVTDVRTSTANTSGYITMNGGATIDNAVLLGQVYEKAITSGIDNEYYAPGVWITGDANIYNSYVSETKNAVQVDSGTVVLENTTISGGAIANLDIGGGDVTLRNCTTTGSTRGGLTGLAVRPKTANCSIHIEGDFKQYNWVPYADIPSDYSGFLYSVYQDSNFAYEHDGVKYINLGMLFVTESGNIRQSAAEAAIEDNTDNNYAFIEKFQANLYATVYTAKAAMGSPEMLEIPEYSPRTNGQHPILPSVSFDYTTKNYQKKTLGDKHYCYYDATMKKVNISFNDGESKTYDPAIFTAKKNGITLPYTVTMNGIDYTGKNITFNTAGNYQLVYTYTDPYNYRADGSAYSVTYTKKLNITVIVSFYDTAFTYDGEAGTYDAKFVVGNDNNTYVSPNVDAVSDTIGKTTVSGQTVYYPIVTVGPTGSDGNTAYKQQKGYYFAPVFSEIHITDFNQQTGETAYEYSKDTNLWPHDRAADAGPDKDLFGYAYGATYSNQPFARSMNTQYYKFGANNKGVCYTTNDIEKDNGASTHLVQYHYVGTDGVVYYYYVQYKFSSMTYKSCVAEGTLVTMADGSQKPIEDIHVGDMVMTWSMWNGCYEAQPVAMHWYHGTETWNVLTLCFSDGTEVRTINEHGFFDTDSNSYVYIRPTNVEDYLSHHFIKQAPDGSNTEVVLTDYRLSREDVGCYSIQTAFNENFLVEGMLSMTGEDYPGRFEYFDIGEGMRYDAEKMQADIDRYGLYSYETFSEWLTPEQFAAFNGQYFKVLVGKGVFTFEDIIGIIRNNLGE